MNGIIIAGGKGTRFRPDKLILPVGGIPVIQRVIETLKIFAGNIIVIANNHESFKFLGTPVIPDIKLNYGPLMGLYTGLLSSQDEWSIVAAGDMPFIKREFLEGLIRIINQEKNKQTNSSYNITAIVPEKDGILQPLLACYSKRFIPYLEEAIETGEKRIWKVLKKNALIVKKEEWRDWDPSGISFTSINTAEEYEKALNIANADQCLTLKNINNI